MDTTFPQAYTIEWSTELPSDGSRHHFFPGGSTQGGHDGLLVKVCPEHGASWVGTFAFGDCGFSGIFSTPDPQRLCVVSRGEGYFVNVTKPSEWEKVRTFPIMDARPVSAHGIIIFADWWDLVAYGATGLAWQTNQLAWDGLRITEVTETHITGTFSKGGEDGCFAVNLKTGEHVGG